MPFQGIKGGPFLLRVRGTRCFANPPGLARQRASRRLVAFCYAPAHVPREAKAEPARLRTNFSPRHGSRSVPRGGRARRGIDVRRRSAEGRRAEAGGHAAFSGSPACVRLAELAAGVRRENGG